MNKWLRLLIPAIALPLNAASIKLAWTPSVSSTTADPGTVNVYRRTSTCPASFSSVTWIKLATGVPAGGPYIDSQANLYYPHCYYVTAVINGKESPPSNLIFVLAAPANLQGLWQK
jgi:hypothetical protein